MRRLKKLKWAMLTVVILLMLLFGTVSATGPTIANSSTPYNPEGCLDGVAGGHGTIKVTGWAFDRNALEKSLNIHVYVGGPYYAANWGTDEVYANTYRPDVNNVFSGVGQMHGFEATLTIPNHVSVPGTYEVYVYAINEGARAGSNYNTCLGHKTVKINSNVCYS